MSASQQQPSGVFATGSAFQDVTGDGSAQKLVVFVDTVVAWVLGTANAQALACGFVCAGANRQIKITAP